MATRNRKGKLLKKLFKYKALYLLFFISISLCVLLIKDAFSGYSYKFSKESATKFTAIQTFLLTPTPIDTPTPTPIPYPTPTPIPWGQTIKQDEHTSVSYFAADDHMSTADELFNAMNQYRQSHSLSTLNRNSTLCNIAQSRANELQSLGKLDNHEGFSKYAHNQQEFNTMDEILFGGVQPVSGVHIVEWGWDKSLTGHHEAISDPQWHDGCSGIAGYFAVFEFGAR